MAELGWVVSFDVYIRRLRRATMQAGAQLSAAAAAHDRAQLAAAYETGRDRGGQVIAQAVAAANVDLEAAWPDLEPSIRTEAGRRLEEVGGMVSAQTLDASDGSLSAD